MINLSKKEAFTLVETFVFVLTLSAILAVSVPLIARKHKHTPKIITHGSYVCYKNSSGQYVEDTYNSRRLIERKIGAAKCTFPTSQNVPIYTITMIPPGGGGVNYFKKSEYNNPSYSQASSISNVRTFTTGGDYSATWNAGYSLDDGMTTSNLKMHVDDLAKAFFDKKYSRCITTRHKSGDAGRYCCNVWGNISKSISEQSYLKSEEYKNNETCNTLGTAAVCSLAASAGLVGVAACYVIDWITGGIVSDWCDDMYPVSQAEKYPGVPINNYPKLESYECRVEKAGVKNSEFCVQTDISRNATNDYYGWKNYSGSNYETFLKKLNEKFTKTYGSNGTNATDYTGCDIWAELYGLDPRNGTDSTESKIKDNWNNVTYHNEAYYGSTGCTPNAYGDCTGASKGGLKKAANFQGGKPDGIFGISSERTPAVIQEVVAQNRYIRVGRRGLVGKLHTSEQLGMRGTCTIEVSSILKAQDENWGSTERTGFGAKMVCKDDSKITFEKTVAKPPLLSGVDQFETRWRGETWADLSEIAQNTPFLYKSSTEFTNTSETDEYADLEAAIKQTYGKNNLWARRDSGKYSKTPFDEFGLPGEGQIVKEDCHPAIWSYWGGNRIFSTYFLSNNLADKGERQIHGLNKVCDTSRLTITDAKDGGPAAVIISW